MWSSGMHVSMLIYIYSVFMCIQLVDQHIDSGGHLNITISALRCPFCPDHRHAVQLRPQYREVTRTVTQTQRG